MRSTLELAFAKTRRRILDELGPFFSEQVGLTGFAERSVEGYIETNDGRPPRTDTIEGQTVVIAARLSNPGEAEREISLRVGQDFDWEPVISAASRGVRRVHSFLYGQK